MSFFSHTLPAKTISILVLILMLFAVLLYSPSSAVAATGINQQINFQGKVVNTDGTNVADGDYDFVFAIYTVDSGGSAIWTENRTGGNQVTVTDGIFRVALGEVTALPGSIDFNTDNIYLGITFNGDGEMSPRVQFTAVPYAFNALKVAGLTVTDTTGTLTIPDSTTITFSGSNDLTVTTTGATNVTFPTTGTLATLTGTETFTNKTIGSTGLTFSGASTDITTATNEDLILSPNGSGNLGIGTTDPSFFIDARRDQDAQTMMRVYNNNDTANAIAGYLFGNSDYGGGFGVFADSFTGGGGLSHVAGRMGLYGDHPLTGTSPLGIDIISPHETVGDIRFYTGGFDAADEQMRIDVNGNVGIGTTSPIATLDVGGRIKVDNGATSTPAITFDANDTMGLYANTVAGGFMIFASGNQDRYWFTSNSLQSSNSGAFYLLRSAGSATTPNFAFYGDEDSGLARATTNEITLVTGGNERLRVDDTGNVGIGSTNPGYKLDVGGTLNLSGAFYANGVVGTAGYLLTSSGGGALSWTDPSSFTGGTGLWTNTLNVLHPNVPYSGVVDLAIGGTSTASAAVRISADGSITATGAVLGTSIDRSSAGALTIGNATATSVSICNSAGCDTIQIGDNADADTITIGDTLDGLTIASSGLNVTSAGAVSGVSTFGSTGDWTWTATTPGITINSGETLTISDGTDSFTVNTSSSVMSFTDGTNSFSFDADTGPSYAGTARPAKRITLSPEYEGATLTASGSATTTGSMTADITNNSSNWRTYYEWTSSETSLQDYTIVVRVTLPQDFDAWATNNALQFNFSTESTSAADNLVDLYLYNATDTAGSIVAQSTNLSSNSAGSWETVTIDDSTIDDGVAPDWDAAGETAIFFLKVSSKDSNYARLSDITLNYLAKY